ncbi:Calcineurin-like phosphoesterase [Geosmithia morbida]|uniref:Calcineurin-like phosphoesterase n=1 Tax=Geosmithia morbida TaxID=1094350 RepID=A0A9P5D0P5_9HYPO|nr:Calcineurin-like phosphoesterase [Geosmithia morbida]KAF4121847.1 Calcineurin-like phosphoesterase [Geosmithia morbida]
MTAGHTRRTRIVCISDTHNSTVRLPPGDVLIHAGDLTNQGSFPELSRAVKWLDHTKFEAKIVVAGIHITPLPLSPPSLYSVHICMSTFLFTSILVFIT